MLQWPALDHLAASAEQVRAQVASLTAATFPPHLRRRLPRLPEAATDILFLIVRLHPCILNRQY